MNYHRIIGSVFENNDVGIHVTEGHSLVSIGNVFKNNGVGFSTESGATTKVVTSRKYDEIISQFKSLGIPENVPEELLIDLINKLKEKQHESKAVKEEAIEQSGLLQYLPSVESGIGIINGLIELVSNLSK
ncbi:Uncharacterised protein [Raoultella terrigena]|uniref:hypothetical protein n=1 Tax=Raoultella terrigena TaxID=577 RepID=UPI000DFDC8A4|nr:hypothetical protein [Raoultella terrigena]SUQ57676.1 Uncharacterised protein [Raoultella terrigena]